MAMMYFSFDAVHGVQPMQGSPTMVKDLLGVEQIFRPMKARAQSAAMSSADLVTAKMLQGIVSAWFG